MLQCVHSVLRLHPSTCWSEPATLLSVTSLHHITILPWHLWQPSEASNLIKTQINLLSDLPDEYDNTCSRLLDLDTYQGPRNHWSWIRGGRDCGGGVRGSKTQGVGVSGSYSREMLAGWAWMTAVAGWYSKAPCKACFLLLEERSSFPPCSSAFTYVLLYRLFLCLWPQLYSNI